MKYVALLRGINVGGKNKISMSELVAVFKNHGFTDVSNYINSGNIMFSYESANEIIIKNDCETLLKNHFHLDIPIVIISSVEYIETMIHAPEWWNKDKESIHNAIFAIHPVTIEDVYAQIGETNPQIERINYYGKVIFWSAPLKTYAKTRLTKIMGTTLYRTITVRNANTTLKLKELLRT